MIMEIWKPVVGFENEYEVSNHGRIKTLKWRKPFKIMRLRISKRGYYYVNLSRNDRKKSYNVHQLVAMAFIGVPPVKHEVCHIDGNRLNSNLANLRYGTRHDNVMDSIRHGTFAGGRIRDKPWKYTPLTQEKVIAIFHSNERPSILARRYNIHHTHISKIKQGKNWGLLTAQLREQC